MNKKYIYLIIIACVVIGFSVLIMPSSDKAKFTQEELNWIRENSDEFFFMGYYDTPSEERFAKKLSQILSSDTGLKIVLYKDTWANTLQLLKKGKVPMCATMNISKERSEYLIFAPSLDGIESGIFSLLENPTKSYKDIAGKNMGVIKNSYLINEFKNKFPEIDFTVTYFDSTHQLALALESGEIDCFMSTRDFHDEMHDFYYYTIPSISVENNHIGVYKDNIALASIISKEVEYLNRINWSSIVKEAISFELEKKAIPFTQEEVEYLTSNPVVTVGLIEGYIPFAYKQDYIYNGIMPNIFKKISYLTDIDFTYVVDSYENLIDNNNVDLIANVTYNNKDYIYTSPVFSDKLVVVAKNTKGFIEEAYELEQYRVGSSSFNFYNNYLTTHMPFIDMKRYDSFDKMFDDIENDKRDYIIVSEAVADVYVDKYPELAFKGILKEDFHCIVTKDINKAILTNIIDKCLQVIDTEAIKLEEISKLINLGDTDKKIWLTAVFIVLALAGAIIKLYINERQVELKLIYTDQNTSVHNRLWLEKQVSKMENLDLFFEIELKNLSFLYERYGKEVYDNAIKKTVNVVVEHLKENEIFANVDKERFIIAKAFISDDDTKAFAQSLSRLFGEKVYVHDLNYSIFAYVGVLRVEDDMKGFNAIIKALDIALYFSKIENNVIYYSYNIFQKYSTQINFDKQFISSVMNGDLEVYYQPIYSKVNGDIFAFDTYINCTLKDYGQINNKSFNNGINKLGLEIEVDKLKIYKVVKQILDWEKEGNYTRVFIGLSPKMLDEKNFIYWLEDIIKEISNSKIIIKLSQEAFESRIDELAMIHSKNISFSIEKFGDNIAGMMDYDESLVEVVSIGTEFLINLTEGKLHEDILDFVIRMGKALNKKVMVNGIVSKNQLAILDNRNIDYVSGNCFMPYVSGKEVCFEGINC